MHVAVEYLYRSVEPAVSRLTFPTSVYLLDEDGSKVVLLVDKATRKHLHLKFYRLDKCKPTDKLPPFDEFVVPQDSLFESESLGRNRYRVLTYTPPMPHFGGGVDAEQELYDLFVNTFWSSPTHRMIRRQFLFDSLCPIYIDPEIYANYGGIQGKHYYQFPLSRHSRRVSTIWTNWRKLFQSDADGIPGEVTFGNTYRPLTAEQYKDHVRSAAYYRM